MYMKFYKNRFCFFYTLLSVTILFLSCNQTDVPVQKLFKLKGSLNSGITFSNTLTESDTLNYFIYPYLYMGGGVATGDINNDGFVDVFFTGNMVENKLYLNTSNNQFEDITIKANISGDNRWYTGVTMVDINNDGWLDIYLSVSGNKGEKTNQLYINNKDLTFTEQAQAYGVDDKGSSTQSVFFDYDKDGDLDLYVANYPAAPFGSSNHYYLNKMNHLKNEDSDHLYKNNGDGTFSDVSKESKIANYGLSLGISVGDYNNDGWDDIYISNDFSTPDRFFINSKDGTFKDEALNTFNHTSLFGMGTDVADYNNDGLLDLIQVDMTPEDNRRSKSNMASMNQRYFYNTVQSGFHYQYMQNCLQLNNGAKADSSFIFSNTARIAGIATTDWSWGPLFADLDNDGWKDIYITNGSRRDVNNKDYFAQMRMKVNLTKEVKFNSKDIPSEPIANYAYKNNADLTFSNLSKEWGLDYKGFTNGVAYADFDNDGDLDLIMNNIDDTACFYENLSNEKSANSYLRFKLQGEEKNRNGIGTKVTVYKDSLFQFQQLTLTRGFQSSVEPVIHFGLGNYQQADSVLITWPDGKKEVLVNVKTNQLLKINYENASNIDAIKESKVAKQIFKDISNEVKIPFKHQENNYNDFLIEPLLPHQFSRLGGSISVGDVNNDGLEDFYVGNAKDAPSALFIQNEEGLFSEIKGPWLNDSPFEDMSSLFFDADGDGDQDLYVVSGGSELSNIKELLQDRLYINTENGFIKSTGSLPEIMSSGSCVKAVDYDLDGDIDLFIGGRIVPGKYPLAARSYILRNEGGLNLGVTFKDVTEELSPELVTPGLVTDALWSDFNSDGYPDLILTGEWMPVLFFENKKSSFKSRTEDFGLSQHTGWWYSLAEGDFDNDGDMDYVAGNLGNNFKYQASFQEPFEIHSGDFDKNGKLDIVLSYYQDGTAFPLRGLECSSQQIPVLKYKYRKYHEFAESSLVDVYGKANLENALHYKATTFSSSYIKNNGKDKWEITALPIRAQLSSINTIISEDINKDGHLDLIIAGNLYSTEVETPRNDASVGLFLQGNGKGTFTPMQANKSGLYINGDIKDLVSIKQQQNKMKRKLYVAIENDGVLKVLTKK